MFKNTEANLKWCPKGETPYGNRDSNGGIFRTVESGTVKEIITPCVGSDCAVWVQMSQTEGRCGLGK